MGTHKYSKRAFEQYLNELYNEIYNEDEAIKHYSYVTKKRSENLIRKAHRESKLGSLIRRHDPVRFNVGYREWINNKELYR